MGRLIITYACVRSIVLYRLLRPEDLRWLCRTQRTERDESVMALYPHSCNVDFGMIQSLDTLLPQKEVY